MLFLKTCRVVFLLSMSLVLAAGQAASQATAQAPNEAAPAAVAPGQNAAAASDATVVPPDTVWYVAMDVKRFVENPLGQQALQLLDVLIRDEPHDFGGIPDVKTAREKLGRVIGFDPLSGIESVSVYGLASPFAGEIRDEEEFVEKMALTAVAVVTLSGGTGNLEGLALAMPEYRSTEYQGATVHSGTMPEIDLKVYLAVLEPDAGSNGIVVVGLDEDQVKRALDRVRGVPAGEQGVPVPLGSPANVVLPTAKGAFLAAGLKLDDQTWRALDIPEQQSAVFRMLKGVAASAGGEGDSVTFELTVEVVNQERAEQVRQLAEGAIAFVQLPIEELEEEEEFLLLREILKGVEVSRAGAHVTARLTRPADTLVEELIRTVNGSRRRQMETRRAYEEEMMEMEQRREHEERMMEMEQRKRAMERDREALEGFDERVPDETRPMPR